MTPSTPAKPLREPELPKPVREPRRRRIPEADPLLLFVIITFTATIVVQAITIVQGHRDLRAMREQVRRLTPPKIDTLTLSNEPGMFTLVPNFDGGFVKEPYTGVVRMPEAHVVVERAR